jgi:putative transposase
LCELSFDEYHAWQKHGLSAKRYVYVWADGICLQSRLEDGAGLARSETARLNLWPELSIADGVLTSWRRASSRRPSARCRKFAMPRRRLTLRLRSMHSSKSYQVKYEKAAECLNRDRDVLLTFYDFPAEHWKHLRTTIPIETTFVTVRHRRVRSKGGCLANRTALAHAVTKNRR